MSATVSAPFYFPKNFMPSNSVYAFASGHSNPISSSFGSLSAAQVVYPFLTSSAQLSYEADACAIQAAINAASAAGGGIVQMGVGIAMCNFQIVSDTSRVKLQGVNPNASLIVCNGGASVVPLELSPSASSSTNYSFGGCVLSDLSIFASASGAVTLASPGPGQAASNYVTGSTALKISGAIEGTIERVRINGFDVPTQWAAGATLNEFFQCSFDGNNKGFVWPQFSYSGTGVALARYRSCYSKGNNYGVFYDSSETSGSVQSSTVDFVLDGCVIADSFVQDIQHTGSNDATVWSRLLITNGHFENSANIIGLCNTSGAGYGAAVGAPCVFTYAKVVIDNCSINWKDQTTPPAAFCNCAAIDAQGTIVSEIIVSKCNFTQVSMPVIGNNVQLYSVEGCTNSDGRVVLAKNTGNNYAGLPNGYILQSPPNPFFNITYGPFEIPSTWLGGIIYTLNDITITIPTNQTLAPGSLTTFRTLDGGTVTLLQDSGTIGTPPGYTNQFGGFAGAQAIAIANTTSSFVLSGNLLPVSETLTVNAIGQQVAGSAFMVSGTYQNGTPAALDYNLGGNSWTTAASPTIDSGNYSFSITISSTNPSQTIEVRDQGNQSVTATSNAFAVVGETLTINEISNQTADVPFTVSGGYSNVALTSIDVSLDEVNWTSVPSPTIGGGSYSFSLTLSTAISSQTIYVRDHINQSVIAVSNAFAVASSGGNSDSSTMGSGSAFGAYHSITVVPPPAWTAGQTVALRGFFTGAVPTGITVGFNSASPTVALGNFFASTNTWFGTLTAPSAGAYTGMNVASSGTNATTCICPPFTVLDPASSAATGTANGPAGMATSAAPALTGVSFTTWPIGVGARQDVVYRGPGYGFGVAIAQGGLGPYTYSITDPAGLLSIDPSYGYVYLEYTQVNVLTPGTKTFTLTVTDALGRTVSSSASISVVNAPYIALQTSIFRTNLIGGIDYDTRDASGNRILSGSQKVTITNGTGAAVNFADIGYNQIAPINSDGSINTSPTPGSYPVTITATNGTTTASLSITFQVVQETVQNIYFNPATISSSTPAGSVVGTAYAVEVDGGDNQYQWFLGSGSSPLFTINSRTGVITTCGVFTSGQTYHLNITCADLTATATNSFAITAQAGTTLPASSLTATVNASLTNFVLSPATTVRTVITPTLPSGITGNPVWTLGQYIVSPFDSDYAQTGPDLTSAHGYRRYEINSTTGVVTTRAQLDAQVDMLTLTVTDGINTCTQTFYVTVAKTVGPKLFVGQGMSSTYPSTLTVTSQYPEGVQGFEHLDTVLQIFNAPNANYAGATVYIEYNSDVNYYANDNNNNQDPRGGNNQFRFGINGPVDFIGTGAARPRLGGVVDAAFGGCDQGGKGFFNHSNGQVSFQNLEISYVYYTGYAEGSIPNGSNSSSTVGCAIRTNGNVWGNVSIVNCYIHHCDQGLQTGDTAQILLIQDTEFANTGGAYLSSGATHSLYIDGTAFVEIDNVLSWQCNNGHELKSRAGILISNNSRYLDTALGSASKQVDACDGGFYVFSNCTFHKGAMAQNPYSVGFCAEMGHVWPLNIMLMNDCTLINDTIAWPGSLTGLNLYPGYSSVDGRPYQVYTFGNSYFGYTQNSALNSGVGGGASNGIGATGKTYTTEDAINSSAAQNAVTESGVVALTARPTINLAHPGAGPWTGVPRPGIYNSIFDGNLDINSTAIWKYIQEVQIDPGLDEITLHVSSVTNGTVVFSPTAYGANYYSLSAAAQPDIRIQPFLAGTTWSLVYNASNYLSYTYPVSPAGTFAINPSTGAVTVLNASALAVGVYHIVVQAVSPAVTSANDNAWVPVGTQFTCQWMFAINVVAA